MSDSNFMKLLHDYKIVSARIDTTRNNLMAICENVKELRECYSETQKRKKEWRQKRDAALAENDEATCREAYQQVCILRNENKEVMLRCNALVSSSVDLMKSLDTDRDRVRELRKQLDAIILSSSEPKQ